MKLPNGPRAHGPLSRPYPGAHGPHSHPASQQRRQPDADHHPRLAGGLRLALEGDDVASPARARAAIRQFCHEHGLGSHAAATLTLLVSELVSNAVRHSGAPPGSEIRLRVCQFRDGVVRVEVIDRGVGFEPILREAAPIAGGYGLHLLELQASRWGCERAGGTRVWFELDPSSQAAA